MGYGDSKLTFITVPKGLSPAEKKILDDFGGWVCFLHSIKLSPVSRDDIEKARAVLRSWCTEVASPSEMDIPDKSTNTTTTMATTNAIKANADGQTEKDESLDVDIK